MAISKKSNGVGNISTRGGAHQIQMIAPFIGTHPWDKVTYLIWKVKVTQLKIEKVTILGTMRALDCIYVCMYVYVCIHMYVHLCMYMCVYILLYLYMYMGFWGKVKCF